MGMRRGFKADANRIALRIRAELGLLPVDPVDLTALGRTLNTTIEPLSALRRHCPNSVRHFTEVESSAFSAVTILLAPGQRLILHNDSHKPPRQRSNIAHEFAHILLDHPMTLPLNDSGCRELDSEIEEEANWLAGAILISDPAAVHIVRSNLGNQRALERYGVSEEMLRFRINATGARKRGLMNPSRK